MIFYFSFHLWVVVDYQFCLSKYSPWVRDKSKNWVSNERAL